MNFKAILKNRVFKNFSYLTIGGILSQLLAVFVVYKLTYILDPENYGVFTFMFIQAQMIMTLSDLGIKNILIRTISRENDKLQICFKSGFVIKILFSFLFMIIYFLYNSIYGNLTTIEVVLVCLISLLFSVNSLFESIFFGLEKMIYPTLINLSYNIIIFILVYIVGEQNNNIVFYFNIFLLVTLLKSLIYFITAAKNKFFRNFFSHELILIQIIKESAPYYFLSLMMLPIVYLSNNFLVINSNENELGYFNFTNKLLIPFTTIFGFALSAIFPNISNLWIKSKEKFYSLIQKGLISYMLFISFLIFCFNLFIKDFLIQFFSNDYINSVEVIKIHIWYVFLMSINSFIGTVWGAANKEKLLLFASALNFCLTTPLLWLTSFYGAYYLSLGYLVSFALFEIYLFIHFFKSFNFNLSKTITPWLLVIAIFFLSQYLDNFNYLMRLLFISLVFLLIYFLQFGSLKFFRNESK